MHRFLSLVIVGLLGLVSGCATITTSEMQSVSVTAHTDAGQPVEKAHCTLRNDKGVWQIDSPGFVSIQRSAEDLLVECKKENLPDGFVRAISRVAGAMFGNIIFGGGIGAIIDHAKGTGYNYPDALPVKMGQSVIVDKRDERHAPEAQSNDSPKP